MSSKALKFTCACGRVLRLHVVDGKLKYEYDETGVKAVPVPPVDKGAGGKTGGKSIADVVSDFCTGSGSFALDVEDENIEDDTSRRSGKDADDE